MPDVTKRVETLIESLQGTIQNTNVWGKRRLAYEVDHLKEGHYVLTDFQIEPVRVPEMEATLKISESVFRHLIVRKPVLKPGTVTEKAAPPPEVEAAGAAETTEATEATLAVDPAELESAPVADELASDGSEAEEEA